MWVCIRRPVAKLGVCNIPATPTSTYSFATGKLSAPCLLFLKKKRLLIFVYKLLRGCFVYFFQILSTVLFQRSSVALTSFFSWTRLVLIIAVDNCYHTGFLWQLFFHLTSGSNICVAFVSAQIYSFFQEHML